MFEKKKKEWDPFEEVIPMILAIVFVAVGLVIFARCCPGILN